MAMTIQKRKKTPGNKWKRIFTWIIVLVGLLALLKIYDIYRRYYASNVLLNKKETGHVYIPTGSTLDEVVTILEKDSIIKDINSFVWLARKKKYEKHIYPGHYLIQSGMSNERIVHILRTGLQTPVKVTFSNVRTKDQFAGLISGQIEASMQDILALLANEQFLSEYGFDTENVLTMFIPNTYEFYWNTSAEQFFIKLNKEYRKFWTEEKISLAGAAGLNPIETGILASIIDEETQKTDEEPAIAGVYINRLKKGMRLQADPTIKFAIGDFAITRVLKKQLEINSPYNTYLHAGLPPGPIKIPSVSAINAVLHYEKHSYLYMCARDDFSGYHHFSKTMEQHLQYAKQYQRALNKRRIMN
jgi:UPF0755 protein